MKHLLKGFVLGATLLFACNAFAAEGVTELNVKNYQVFAIDDAQNVFNTSIFPNIQEHADKLALMPGGKAEGVYRTYLVLGKNKVMLIDTGWGSDFGKKGQTVAVLKEKGLTPDMVTDIYMTHLDGDHISGLIAGESATYPNAKIHMSQAEYDGWLVRGDARNPRSIVKAREILKLYEGRIENDGDDGGLRRRLGRLRQERRRIQVHPRAVRRLQGDEVPGPRMGGSEPSAEGICIPPCRSREIRPRHTLGPELPLQHQAPPRRGGHT